MFINNNKKDIKRRIHTTSITSNRKPFTNKEKLDSFSKYKNIEICRNEESPIYHKKNDELKVAPRIPKRKTI
jgi:hypothetical protein